MKHHFTLRKKGQRGSYQACFCFMGEVKWVGLDCSVYRDAWKKAVGMEESVLKDLTVKAALKGKGSKPPADTPCDAPVVDAQMTPVDDEVTDVDPRISDGQKPDLPPLNLSVPPPKGSLREGAMERLAFVNRTKQKETVKREAKQSFRHLCEALQGLVDRPLNSLGADEGEWLVAYFNNPVRFPISGPSAARKLRSLLKPLEKSGLREEFLEVLERVEKQLNETERSDPYLAHHFAAIDARLNSGLEPDYLRGLDLIGWAAAPQIIDASLLQWEGVDFDANEVRLFRIKTVVLARFDMTPELREWLLHRWHQAKPGDVYVFWELVFLQREIEKKELNKEFNKEVIKSNKRIGSISSTTGTLWREFLFRCGLPVPIMTLNEGDISDIKGFAAKLRLMSSPLAAWLAGQFNPRGRRILAKEPASPDEWNELEVIIDRNLNQIIKKKKVYEEARFEGIYLSPAIRELLQPGQKRERLHRLNRLLLEAAFPELKRVKLCKEHYTYSSYRKHLAPLIRSLRFRDEVGQDIMGHDWLGSQFDYSSSDQRERARAAELFQRIHAANIRGQQLEYPTNFFDLQENMSARCNLQDKNLERLLAEQDERSQRREAAREEYHRRQLEDQTEGQQRALQEQREFYEARLREERESRRQEQAAFESRLKGWLQAALLQGIGLVHTGRAPGVVPVTASGIASQEPTADLPVPGTGIVPSLESDPNATGKQALVEV